MAMQMKENCMAYSRLQAVQVPACLPGVRISSSSCSRIFPAGGMRFKKYKFRKQSMRTKRSFHKITIQNENNDDDDDDAETNE